MKDLTNHNPPLVSRDEMNLAEFPLAVLSTRSDPSLKTLEFKDQIHNKNGEIIERKWIITGADKFGLPTASDDEVLLGLMKLTVEDGFRSHKVYFTRYELLRILSWTTEGRSYTRLQRALDRLSGVRIKASNAFYDNESKSHSTRNFGIIDAYEINDGRDSSPKPSFFTWSETIFKSFQVGFIKKLDLDFYLSLRSAVSKRLYRFLDKHFWYKSTVQISLFTLAHEKLGVSRNYRYASSIRQQLDPAFEELVNAGFLSEVQYRGRGQNCEVICCAASKTPRSKCRLADKNKSEPFLAEAIDLAGQLDSKLFEALTQRGLQARQVQKLLEGRSEQELARMVEIIRYYDELLASGSKLVSRSPVGFLYRAIEKADKFLLPGQEKPAIAKQEQFKFPSSSGAKEKKRGRDRSDRQAEYLVFRKKWIAQQREQIDQKLLKGMRSEVEAALGRVRGLISEQRFAETVEHGIDEKIAKLFAIPEYEEWLAGAADGTDFS